LFASQRLSSRQTLILHPCIFYLQPYSFFFFFSVRKNLLATLLILFFSILLAHWVPFFLHIRSLILAHLVSFMVLGPHLIIRSLLTRVQYAKPQAPGAGCRQHPTLSVGWCLSPAAGDPLLIPAGIGLYLTGPSFFCPSSLR
jgi:hypothetical protein